MNAENDIVVHRPYPRWLRRLLAAAIVVALLLALIPAALRLGIEHILHQRGLDQVNVGRIAFNPFTLHFTLDGLNAGHGKQTTLKFDRLQLRLAWRPLFHKRLVLDSLALRGASIDVVQGADGAWQIGGIALPPPAAAKPAPAPAASPWGFGLRQLRLEQVTCQLTLPRLRSTVELDALTMHDLYTWQPQQPTQLQLRGAVNGSAITLDAQATPLAGVVTARSRLTVRQLALAPFMALAPAGAPAVDGRLSVDGTFGFRGDHITQRLTQQGTIALARLAVEQKPWRIASGGLQWNGGLALTLEQGEVHALEATGAASADKLTIGGTTSAADLLQLGGVKTDGIVLRGPRDIAVADVALRDLRVRLQRDARGRLLLPAAAGHSAPGKTLPLALRIGHVALGGDSRVTFTDHAVSPTYRQTLYISSATLDGLDNRPRSHPAAFRLRGRAGKYTPLEFSGELRPFTGKVNLALHGEVKGVELPRLTPYTRHYLGYDLSSGQLAAKMNIKITNDVLDGNNDLHIHELTIKPTDPAKMAKFNKQLNIPLDTALYMLKDDHNNIKLKLPISGNLNDPSFNLSDAINTALAKTMKLATVSYLKLLLQPYSTLYILASLVDSAASIKLQPLTYPPTVAALDARQRPYLGKIAGLFKKRPKLQLRLCGFATPADRSPPPKNRKPPTQSEVTTQLEALARRRAEGVKDLLVTQYGVAPGQLFVCRPQIDTDAADQPRVELLL